MDLRTAETGIVDSASAAEQPNVAPSLTSSGDCAAQARAELHGIGPRCAECAFDRVRVRSLWLWLAAGGLIAFAPTLAFTWHWSPVVSAALVAFCPPLATCVLGLWLWMTIKTKRIDFGVLMGRAPATWRPWGAALLGLLAAALVGQGTGTVALLALRWLSSSPSIVPFVTSTSTLSTVLGWCDAVLLVPVVEEIVFRGIVLHRWAQKWGPTKGILGSALLFGLMHADVVGLTAFGLVMAVLYVRTRTLWVPIVCHVLFNAGAMTAATIRLPDHTTLLATILASRERMWPAVLGVSAVVAFAGGAYLVRRCLGGRLQDLPYFANRVPARCA